MCGDALLMPVKNSLDCEVWRKQRRGITLDCEISLSGGVSVKRSYLDTSGLIPHPVNTLSPLTESPRLGDRLSSWPHAVSLKKL